MEHWKRVAFFRPTSRCSQQAMTSRFCRFLVSVLIAVAMVASPTPYFATQGASLHHHPSTHLPRKHQHTPLVTKLRTILAASARLCSANDSESRPRTAKRLSSVTSCPNALGSSAVIVGLQQVFCPLRC